MVNQLTIIGLGLIGGSVASAIKTTDFCRRIVGYDNDSSAIAFALEKKYIDIGATDLTSAINQADLILIATPIGQFSHILKEIRSAIKPSTIITDVCSVKSSIIISAEDLLGKDFANFVPGHPIAGSEKSGVIAAKNDLFHNQPVILTPTQQTDAQSLETITKLWEIIGAKVKRLDAETHDQIFSLTSHLPQLLAYAFMDMLIKQSHYPELLNFIGNGFRDFTRIAASSPNIWMDIFATNRDNLLAGINDFENALSYLKQALLNNDVQNIKDLLSKAAEARTKVK